MQLENVQLELATSTDAHTIAMLSRELIETGLSWRWRSLRIAKLIYHPEAVVLTARIGSRVIGFAIMQFAAEDAHLLLFAVIPEYRYRGLGRALWIWLEKSARTAGIVRVHLEVRANNLGAQTFYQRLGFTQVQAIPHYYDGREAAVRMVNPLIVSPPN